MSIGIDFFSDIISVVNFFHKNKIPNSVINEIFINPFSRRSRQFLQASFPPGVGYSCLALVGRKVCLSRGS